MDFPPPLMHLLIPDFVGLMVSLGMYGISVGQCFHYYRNFSSDKRRVKHLVAFLMIMNTFHVYCSVAYEWFILVPCRHNNIFACLQTSTWQMVSSLFLSFFVPFIVQSFYGQRIWIISGKNKILVGAIFFMAAAQLVIGSAIMVLYSAGNPVATSEPVLVIVPVTSVAADMMISGSVYFYLRPGRFGIRRTETRIRHLAVVSINMGFFTCAVGLVTVALVVVPKSTFGVAGIGAILVKSHVNSALAVLNARRTRRKGRIPDSYSAILLPDISTICVTPTEGLK
ncbi:hypothetical protein BJ138DRAFT_1154245 [Hygrophoropsis aurantiaca]|uniref:Uncharacterized protein n=1 Tax=Hygrophoropsis aurantiaca TaxID=72124 RepID=A0ACB8A9I0_9AGAM|nr:hypothetical protein BJ138DRAFT_1154245 [Hygrophoropsis aurantiaca]